MAIKAIFFDAAGTLIKPARRVGETYAVLAQKYGVDVLKVDVTNTDIRNGEGKARFLDEVSAFLAR